MKTHDIDKETLALLLEYHEYQGDRLVRFIKALETKRGATLYLMRFDDKRGEKYSSVDMICHAANGTYATELFSSKRENEKKMLAYALEETDEDWEE